MSLPPHRSARNHPCVRFLAKFGTPAIVSKMHTRACLGACTLCGRMNRCNLQSLGCSGSYTCCRTISSAIGNPRGYPDCRPEFIAAYEQMANLATKAGVEGHQHLKIHTPLLELTKAQIVQEGLRLGVDYSMTSSCYDPGTEGEPCGLCDSCQLRARGFSEAGLDDPLLTRFTRSGGGVYGR